MTIAGPIVINACAVLPSAPGRRFSSTALNVLRQNPISASGSPQNSLGMTAEAPSVSAYCRPGRASSSFPSTSTGEQRAASLVPGRKPSRWIRRRRSASSPFISRLAEASPSSVFPVPNCATRARPWTFCGGETRPASEIACGKRRPPTNASTYSRRRCSGERGDVSIVTRRCGMPLTFSIGRMACDRRTHVVVSGA